MANTSISNVSNLDVSAYRDGLENYLKNQGQFKDFVYDGSNLSVELDLLAFNTYQNAFLLNMVASEMFQDSAVLRESAVSHAKELNYIPRSRVSSTALVNVTITPSDNPSLVIIPKFYSFVSQSQQSGRSFIFSTNQPIAIRNNGGTYVANNVQIYEGRVVSEYFVADPSIRYVISSANVDISSIDVNIQNSATDTTNVSFAFAESLFGLNANSTVYFLQGYGSDQYEIVFGNGITGQALTQGNIIKVTYRDSSGTDGDGILRFQPASTIQGYTNISVTSSDNNRSSGGGERESIESIKFNAPRHYATQGRAINSSDYETIIQGEFPSVESLAVFGGENLPQKQYGKIAISAKPFGGQSLTTAVKNSILNYVSQMNPIEIVPVFVDPEFFYLEINSSIYFDINKTTLNANDLQSVVLTALSSFSTTYLQDFRKSFYRSRLETYINSADISIVSNQTRTRVIKRKAPIVGIGQTININYNAALNALIQGKRAIESSYFVYTFKSVDYNCFIGDDYNGNLNIYTLDSNGTEIVLVPAVGTVNYTTGFVTTNPIIFKSYQGYISFYARTSNFDYNVSLNQIIVIDPNDVNIDLNKVS